jgi:hypothetical protein
MPPAHFIFIPISLDLPSSAKDTPTPSTRAGLLRIQPIMELEELPPNKPNFGLILVLFCVAIVCIFAFVLLIMHTQGHDQIKHHVATPATSSALHAVSKTLAA